MAAATVFSIDVALMDSFYQKWMDSDDNKRAVMNSAVDFSWWTAGLFMTLT